jgi:hypothetical protein
VSGGDIETPRRNGLKLPSSARTLSPISSTSMIFISGAPGSVAGIGTLRPQTSP